MKTIERTVHAHGFRSENVFTALDSLGLQKEVFFFVFFKDFFLMMFYVAKQLNTD